MSLPPCLVIVLSFFVLPLLAAMPTPLAAADAPPPPAIVAHRGASHDAPENTLAAFRLAFEQGADAIEGDFHLSKDGQIACIHDADTQRVAGRKLLVAKTEFAELAKLDVGTWKDPRFAGERIPTLREVLAVVPARKGIFIEVKCGVEIMPALRADLRASGIKPAQVTIISFNAAVVAAARKEWPGIKANWLTSYKEEPKGSGHWTPDADILAATLKRCGATGLGTAAHARFDEGLAKAVAQAGCELHCWTVDDPATARRFIALGTRSITTNRPGWLREQLRGR